MPDVEILTPGETVEQYVGQTAGLCLQSDWNGFEGDGLDEDSTVDDITTEPDNPGYERLVLKNGMNPEFDVREYDGAIDSVFILDDGELDAIRRLGIPVDVSEYEFMATLTPKIMAQTEVEA